MTKLIAVLMSLLFATPLLYGGVVPGTNCTEFPSDNVWNTPINDLPVNPYSAAWEASLPGQYMTLGFGPAGGKHYGFPFQAITSSIPLVKMTFSDPSESDPGGYPFNASTPIEPYDGGDKHALMIGPDPSTAAGTCYDYELYDAKWSSTKPKAANGEIWNLSSNNLIWNSAYPTADIDDAGLPLFAGLVRYDEVAAGLINHALRFEGTQAYSENTLWPGTYIPTYLDTPNPNVIWMASRWRLKSTYDISSFSTQAQVILTALKTYGMFMSDIGDDWQLDGTLDTRWTTSLMNELVTIPSSEFEAVDESCLEVSATSGQVAPSASSCSY
ncbi:MAG: hypothetical protein WB762_23875 [Candidatus Sulfotelmatobacter sp.]